MKLKKKLFFGPKHSGKFFAIMNLSTRIPDQLGYLILHETGATISVRIHTFLKYNIHTVIGMFFFKIGFYIIE